MTKTFHVRFYFGMVLIAVLEKKLRSSTAGARLFCKVGFDVGLKRNVFVLVTRETDMLTPLLIMLI